MTHITHLRPSALDEPFGSTTRMGLINLSTDPIIERDFHALVPDERLAVFSTRIPLEIPNSERTFAKLHAELEPAARLLVPLTRLDSIVFGCTSASTVIGPDNVEAAIRRARPDAYVTNPATAAIRALTRLKARNVAVVTPYTMDMAAHVVEFVEGQGFAVHYASGAGFDDDQTIGSIPPAYFVDVVRSYDLSSIDAIFFSCTGIQVLDSIARVEEMTGLPVVTSNQAAFWDAARMGGWRDPIHGYGRLLEGEWD